MTASNRSAVDEFRTNGFVRVAQAFDAETCGACVAAIGEALLTRSVDLRVVLLAMAQWGERWRDDPDITHLEVRETASGEPVSVELVRRGDTAILGPDAITVTRRKKKKRKR